MTDPVLPTRIVWPSSPSSRCLWRRERRRCGDEEEAYTSSCEVPDMVRPPPVTAWFSSSSRAKHTLVNRAQLQSRIDLPTMPAALLSTTHIRPLDLKRAPHLTTSTAGLQDIAEKHITKGLGRLRDHVFKEGKGLRVLTTVSLSTEVRPVISHAQRHIGRSPAP